jgi:hypothetical protein
MRMAGAPLIERDPFRDSVRQHDQIDVNRDGCRWGNNGRRCLREEGLGRGRKGIAFDPHEFLPGGTATLDSVTGWNTLTTRSSYSTWSMTSSPRTTWAS